jgi:tripartite-type tricarboxylate transporter receptor subunit TctC
MAGFRKLFVCLASLAAAGPVAARADDFYHGKTLTIVVGFTPGGGFDVNARVLAKYIGRHIPGNPGVVVQNMPGAASLTSVIYLDTNAPKDGTVVTTFNFGQIGNSKLQPDKVGGVDFRNYAWLGSISNDTTVCYAWHNLGIKTLDDMRRHGPIHMGLTSIGASSDVNQRILKYIFKIDVRQVAGYPGSAEERLGIERGELDGDCGAWASIPQKWVEDKSIDPVVKTGRSTEAGMPPNIPFVEDLAPSDEAREIIHLLIASGDVGRPFIASKAVPADRLAILRKAFDETMKDKDFVAELARLKIPYQPKGAAAALDVVKSIYAAPEDVVQKAKKIATE